MSGSSTEQTHGGQSAQVRPQQSSDVPSETVGTPSPYQPQKDDNIPSESPYNLDFRSLREAPGQVPGMTERREWKAEFDDFQHLGGGKGDTPRPPYSILEGGAHKVDASLPIDAVDSSRTSQENIGKQQMAGAKGALSEVEEMKAPTLSSPLLRTDIEDSSSQYPDSGSTLTTPGLTLTFEKNSH